MGVHELEKEILQASLFFWAGVSWKCHCLTERAFVLWCGKAHANIRYRWGSYSQSRASVYVDVCHFCCNNHLAETKLVRKCSSKNSDLHESCGCTFAPGWESTQALSVLTGTHTHKNGDLSFYSRKGQTHYSAFVCIHDYPSQIITTIIIIMWDLLFFNWCWLGLFYSSLKILTLLEYLSIFSYKQLAKSTSQTATEPPDIFSYLK